VGLNPGTEEFAKRRFFVGRAGAYLRSPRYDLLWASVGPATETLVTNIVKLSTPRASDLDAIDHRTIAGCVRHCFLEEVHGMPSLERLFILGGRAARLFRQIALPELTDQRRLKTYSVRHPSFCWTVPDLEERLRQQLREPWEEVRREAE